MKTTGCLQMSTSQGRKRGVSVNSDEDAEEGTLKTRETQRQEGCGSIGGRVRGPRVLGYRNVPARRGSRSYLCRPNHRTRNWQTRSSLGRYYRRNGRRFKLRQLGSDRRMGAGPATPVPTDHRACEGYLRLRQAGGHYLSRGARRHLSRLNMRGMRVTGSLDIKDEMVVGTKWVDKPAFRDGSIVWRRVVADVPDSCRELIPALAVDRPS